MREGVSTKERRMSRRLTILTVLGRENVLRCSMSCSRVINGRHGDVFYSSTADREPTALCGPPSLTREGTTRLCLPPATIHCRVAASLPHKGRLTRSEKQKNFCSREGDFMAIVEDSPQLNQSLPQGRGRCRVATDEDAPFQMSLSL